jgi:hypothetical protein
VTHEMKDYVSLGLAWGGSILSALTSNLHLWLSAGAALAALIASFYSIRINRAKWLKIKAHEEALCKACGEKPGSVECPFPSDERPETCRLRFIADLKKE